MNHTVFQSPTAVQTEAAEQTDLRIHALQCHVAWLEAQIAELRRENERLTAELPRHPARRVAAKVWWND